MQMRASFSCSSHVLFSGLLWGRERQLHVRAGRASDPLKGRSRVSCMRGNCIVRALRWLQPPGGVFIFSHDSFWFVLSCVNQSVWNERVERQLFAEESASEWYASASMSRSSPSRWLYYWIFVITNPWLSDWLTDWPPTEMHNLKYVFCVAGDGTQRRWRHFERRQYEQYRLSASATTIKYSGEVKQCWMTV